MSVANPGDVSAGDVSAADGGKGFFLEEEEEEADAAAVSRLQQD